MRKFFKNSLVALSSVLISALMSCSSDDGGTTTTPVDPVTSTEVRVEADISANTTWSAGNEYILTQRVYVNDGATLTIEPGVVVKGGAGTGTNSKALIVRRGGVINASGTATAPIIFTSTADEITSAQVLAGNFISPNLDQGVSGQWGGLIILGKAPIEASAAELQIEGIPTSESALYGGTDAADNSGTIRYVSIRHGGTNIGANNEINGLTLGGVGNGTTIEFVEVVANQDDGIEWFGGSVNVSNAIVWNNGDDAYDTDQGWSGTLNNFVAVTPAGSGLELDGAEDDDSGTSRHTLSNGLVSSPGGNTADMDPDSRVNLQNILFDGISLNADNTPANTFASATAAQVTFTDVFVTVPSATTLSAIFGGTVPAGASAGTTNTVTTSAFSGWSWAGQVLGY